VGQESREVSREESRQVSPQESREEPQESHQEPRREAILGVPAALAASTVAAEAVPAIALDPPKAERAPPSLIIRQMDRDELAFLVRRGEIFINSGDVAAARLIVRLWVSNLRLQTETGLSRSFILFSPKKGAHP
jgi:hypothetical protein